MAIRRSRQSSNEEAGAPSLRGEASGQCPHCGAAVEPGGRFCSECGNAQGAGAAPPGAERGDWHLVVVEGPDAGRRFRLGAQARVGRNSDSDVHLADPQASRLHATIEKLRDGYVISDQGSRNGTFLSGVRLEGPARLRNGDLIKIGTTLLEVVAPAAPAPRPAAAAAYPSPSAQPIAPRGEGVVGVIPHVERRKGLIGRESFTLVLTPERLILAKMTSEMMKAIVAQARQEAKAEGKGFFGQWGAQLGAYAAHAQRYLGMPVEAILRENPDNFQIPLSQVRQVRIKTGFRDEQQNNPDRLEIHAGDKMKFDLKGTSAGQAKKVLRQVLGDRVK